MYTHSIANNNGHGVNSPEGEGAVVKLSSDSDSECGTKVSPINMLRIQTLSSFTTTVLSTEYS